MKRLIVILLLTIGYSLNAQIYLDGLELKKVVKPIGIEIYEKDGWFKLYLDKKIVTDANCNIVWFTTLGDIYQYLLEYGINLDWNKNEIDMNDLPKKELIKQT